MWRGTFRQACVLVLVLAAICLPATRAAGEDDSTQSQATESRRKDIPIRWSPAQNRTWRWFERETLVRGKWRLDGITTPIHRQTGERFAGAKGYLADDEVAVDVRRRGHAEFDVRDVDRAVYLETDSREGRPLENDPAENNEPGKTDPIRKTREGRPASKWLRGLAAAELREWLPTVDPPEAGVEGMTFYEHLTRDHGFRGENVKDLTEEEQAKLHAAAHAGY